MLEESQEKLWKEETFVLDMYGTLDRAAQSFKECDAPSLFLTKLLTKS